MKYIILILLVLAFFGGCLGYYINAYDPRTGEFLIGISIAISVFITMPIFIYYRWKNRSVKDYMLTKENIEKMREYHSDAKK